MSYGIDLGELGQRMAGDVHEILSGTKPGDIPIYQSTKFQFVINVRAAEPLGLAFPPALLAQADEVINSCCRLLAWRAAPFAVTAGPGNRVDRSPVRL